MGLVKFFVCLYTVLIASSYAEDKQVKDSLEGVNAKKERTPRISSEFGYNILNSDQVSNQFRQEHRDTNGVVRGSYGFKNPNGAFRFVHYVADDKGFRAHISSNEDGVGHQNPASVSFDHFPSVSEDKSKLLISTLKKQSSLNDMLKPEAHLTRYDFYTPIDGNKFNAYQNYEQSSIDKKNTYRYDIRGHELLTTFKQNPVDKLIKTRIGVPGEFLNTFSQNKKHSPLWDSSPYSTISVDQPFAQDYNVNSFPSTLYDTLLTSNTDNPDLVFRSRGNNRKNIPSSYPRLLASLLHKPKQKVHTSLPDCNSVSSAVLCKPPLIFGRNSQGNSVLNNNKYFLEDSLQTSPTHTLFPEEKPHIIDTEYSDFEELLDQTKRTSLPHLVPNSYPLRSDIYKNFLNYLHEHSKHDEQDINCQKHGLVDETSKDYITSLESHKLSHDAVATGIILKNGLISQNYLEQNSSPQYPVNNRDEEFYSSLIRVIQNDESLNKLKNLILQPNLSSTDSVTRSESPKLSLLGVLILPSNIINELSNKGLKKSLATNVLDISNENILPYESPKADTLDNTKENTDSNSYHSEVSYDVDSDVNVTSGEDHDLGSETTKYDSDLQTYIPLIRAKPYLQTANNTSDFAELPVETVTSSKFYVYDDQSNSSENEKSSDHSSNSSPDDWRKVLEEEISKEIRGMSLDEGPSSDKIMNSKRPDQQYTINKHIGPLYDSTGKLIEPENVPIHIHRFNPPSGLSSLPWKYSIPRPAPPRSIVVPPKPPTLS